MQHRTPSCQLPHARTGDSRQKSPSLVGVPRQKTGPGTALRVAPTGQWLTTTTGRVATDGHSWLTAIHWAAKPGRYTPSRSHGPKGMNTTTLALVQELANLNTCRPGIAYLMRKLKASERTVEYHLDMLREAGLLVYRSKGTRTEGSVRHASVYERVIPLAFDTAHGIRTIQHDEDAPAHTRVPVGAAPEHRKSLGKLAKQAARKVRRRASRTRISRKKRCTPMQGCTSASTPAGITHSPPEKDIASGSESSPTQKQSKHGRRNLNRYGRRLQLGRELVETVPWLHGASPKRIAWVARHCADEGWTALEVRAVAESTPLTDRKVLRPSGMLAHRLKGAHLLYTTPERRQTAVDAWQDSPAAERARHEGYEQGITGTPTASHVQKILHGAVARMRTIQEQQTAPQDSVDIAAGTVIDIEALDRATVVSMRELAQQSPSTITTALDLGMSESDARRLYTHRLVDLALKSFTPHTTFTA